jgi:hypothetical protein
VEHMNDNLPPIRLEQIAVRSEATSNWLGNRAYQLICYFENIVDAGACRTRIVDEIHSRPLACIRDDARNITSRGLVRAVEFASQFGIRVLENIPG